MIKKVARDQDKRRFNFTKQALEKLQPPGEGKRTYYYDLKVRGLGASVTSKGTISFIVYRKINGSPERITLGRYPDLSIENARTKALEINTQIAQGKNPKTEASKLKNEPRLKELFVHYFERHSKTHKKS